MKKILAAILALLMAATMAACSSNESNDSKENDDKNVTEEKTDKVKSDKEESEKDFKIPGRVSKIFGEEDEEDVEIAADEEIEKEDKKETEEDADEKNDEAESVAESFMDALCEFDIVGMSKYCDVDLAEQLGYDSLEEMIYDMLSEELGVDDSEEMQDALDVLIDAFLNGILDNTSYSIKDFEIEDGKWIYNVLLNSIKISDIAAVFEDEEFLADIEAKITEKYINKIDEDFSEDDLNELMNNMFKDMFGMMADAVTEACEDAEPESGECVITVYENDGELAVSESESNIDAWSEILNG